MLFLMETLCINDFFLCFQDAVTAYATDSGRPVFDRLWLTQPVHEALHQHHLILASEAEYLLR